MPKIGQQVNKLRTRRALGTRDLAERAGISHSTISLIERDAVSPSIDTLAAIAEALGTTLIGLLSGMQRNQDISPFYRAEELTEIGDHDASGISYRVIGLNHPDRHILMLHEKYAPGGDTRATITHHAQEAGIVIAGAVEVTVGERSATLKAGDAYYFDSVLPHRFRNISEEPAEIVSAITPPSF